MHFRIAVISTFCVWHCAFAQQDGPSRAQEPRLQPEEIVITGARLRNQLMVAEKKAYDIFNQFNDEKLFKISCSINKPTGTLFERQVCAPAFEERAMAEHAQDYMATMSTVTGSLPDGSRAHTYAPMEVEIIRHQPAFKRKIKQVAEEHPEFLEALIQYNKLREQYEKPTSTTGK